MNLKRTHQNAIVPTYATDGSACFDLYSIRDYEAGDIMRTGWAFEVPTGHVMMIYSRSGHGFQHNVRLANCVGVIDSDYRGEVAVKLAQDSGGDKVVFRRGERIAQAMIIPVEQVEFQEVNELSETVRGNAGYGSTGK